jgi:hypothetical protein
MRTVPFPFRRFDELSPCACLQELVVTFLLFGGDPLFPSELLVKPLEKDGILLVAIGARKLKRVPRLSVTLNPKLLTCDSSYT